MPISILLKTQKKNKDVAPILEVNALFELFGIWGTLS